MKCTLPQDMTEQSPVCFCVGITQVLCLARLSYKGDSSIQDVIKSLIKAAKGTDYPGVGGGGTSI